MNILNETNRLVDSNYIEEMITNLQLNKDVQSSLNSIKKTLNSSFNNIVCDDIFIGEKSNKMYGMCVYPTEDSLKQLAITLIDKNKTSKDITKSVINNKIYYVIEIDPELLYNKFVNFQPDELTAILLHEIGHVTSDSDFYNDIAFAYRNAVYNLNMDKNKFSEINTEINMKSIAIGMLYILSSLQTTRIMNKSNGEGEIEREQIADKFVIDNGYGKALSSALKKFSKVYLTNYKKQTKKSYEAQLQIEAENIVSLSRSFDMRRNYVKEVLNAESKRTPSKYLKNLLDKIGNDIKHFLPKYKPFKAYNAYTESAILKESFVTKLYRNPMKISQADIDDLTIQVEMMDDWDDKTVLVYKIHKRLAQLAEAEEKYKDDKELKMIIDRYRNELNTLLTQAMKFKPVKKSYGVFIKYPKGYEG